MVDKQTTKVLKDFNLKDLIPRLLKESIILNIINKLSIDELRKPGLANRNETKREMYCV